MKSLFRSVDSLSFRIIVPVLVLILFLGFSLYLFVLKTLSDFADRQVKESLMEISRTIYTICDKNLAEIMQKGQSDNNIEVRIKKALTIGMIEDYMRQNNLEGSITEHSTTVFSKGITENLSKLIEHTVQEGFVGTIKHNEKIYYTVHMHFEPWKWHVFFIKDTSAYALLIHKVRLAYGVTGIILLAATFLLLYYLRRTVEEPISTIITPLKKGELPAYRGISEFEFLSDNIRQMLNERQMMMSQIIQEQKLKGINVLATGIAHNFNNVLVSVLGYTNLIRINLDTLRNNSQPSREELLDETIGYLSVIENSTHKAGNLARELAAFSKKMSSGELQRKPTDVNAIVTELKQLLEKTFPRNIALTIDLYQDLPMINGDAAQLEQALLNICINSKDAMPEGGELIMKTQPYRVHKRDIKYPFVTPGRYIAITIYDTGIGMDPEVMNRIFEPFFTTKPVDKGIGLGLAMVYATIKTHQGHIITESTPHVGTTIAIYLPCEE